MADSPKNHDGKAEEADAAAASEVKPDTSATESGGKTRAAGTDAGTTTGEIQSKEAGEESSFVAHKAEPLKKAATGPRGAKTGKTPAKAARAAGKPAKAAPVKKAATSAAKKANLSPKVRPVSRPAPSIKELKDKIMASTPDYNANMSEAVAELQDRSKAAYEKSSEMMGEMSDFAKGSAEALVESTKIFAAGMQEMGKTYVEEAKSAYEQMTTDLKEMAAIKSPTELFQLQGKMMRRNFDALVATTSKNAELAMKLSNDAFTPLSARMNVAADKFSKIA